MNERVDWGITELLVADRQILESIRHFLVELCLSLEVRAHSLFEVFHLK